MKTVSFWAPENKQRIICSHLFRTPIFFFISDRERQLTSGGYEEQSAVISVPNILYPSLNPTEAGVLKKKKKIDALTFINDLQLDLRVSERIT